MESERERLLATWSAPECAFPVEYSVQVIDDIRLAVVDAFFSLPRGGAEIGGVLLGSFEGGRLRIVDYAPLECEHATGPSFTLSDRDHARLAALLSEARGNAADRRPVGWYHSHTRSEIFLSEADAELHRRYFPEPWQVAVVLRPHTFQATRAGLFFRKPDGSLDARPCGEELVLAAQAVKPVPPGISPVSPSRLPREAGAHGRVITIRPDTPAAPQPSSVEAACQPDGHAADLPQGAAAAPEAAPEPPPIPHFLEPEPVGNRRGVWILVAAGVLVAMGAAAFQFRQFWLPRLSGLIQRAPAAASASLGLNAIDIEGQLQIRWDRNSAAVANALEAILVILDGPAPQAIELDPAHLRTGVFTYARQGARVDVTLTVHESGGRTAREATSFLGKIPSAPSETPEARQQRDDLAQQAAKLKSDLNAQTARTKKLEHSMEDMQKQLNEQQQRRLQNMDK